MPRPINILVYDDVNIHQWTDEIKTLPDKISKLETQRNVLSHQIYCLNQEIAPYDQQINGLNSRISSANINTAFGAVMALDGYQRDSLVGAVETGVGAYTAFTSISNASNLQNQRDQARQERQSFLNAKAELQGKLNPLAQKLARMQAQLKFAKKHFEPAINFVLQLQDPQSTLHTWLYENINLSLQQFEIDHPALQSESVRYQLSLINSLLYNSSFHLNFNTLRAALWQNYNATADNNKNSAFLDMLTGLIQSTHLPDNSANYYAPAQSLEEFLQLEQNTLTNLCLTLKKDFHEPKYRYALNLINHIEDAAQQEDADIKFYTTILRHAEYILSDDKQSQRNLNNPEIGCVARAQARCFEFANLLQDKPNSNKKIAGALLMFAGAGLIIGSVIAAFLSSGLLSPVSAYGIAKGIALLGSGCAAFVGGASLFYSGRRKGASRALTEFVQNPVTEQDAADTPQLYIHVTGADNNEQESPKYTSFGNANRQLSPHSRTDAYATTPPPPNVW